MNYQGFAGLILIATSSMMMYYLFVYSRVRNERRLLRLGKSISQAMEQRAHRHYGLSALIEKLADQVAVEMQLTKSQRAKLRTTVYLRDFGLSSVPYKVLNTVEDWSMSERNAYDRHPELSAAVAESHPMLKSFAPAIRHHHRPYESMQGLPVESRIIHAVSDFLWTERFENRETAERRLLLECGGEFDPVVVRAMKTVLGINESAHRMM